MAFQSYLLPSMLFGISVAAHGQNQPAVDQELGIEDICRDSNGVKAQPPKMTGMYIGGELFTQSDISAAVVSSDEFDGNPVILITFSDKAAARFTSLTERNLGQLMPMFLDGKLLSCPVTLEPISGGQVQINGVLSATEAEKMVRRIIAYVD